jgi:hypothetical protein
MRPRPVADPIDGPRNRDRRCLAGRREGIGEALDLGPIAEHPNNRSRPGANCVKCLEQQPMRLICYATSGEPPAIVPAPVERSWMDRTNNGFAYRCLPLNIANAHGWLILNPVAFVAEWNGGPGPAETGEGYYNYTPGCGQHWSLGVG